MRSFKGIKFLNTLKLRLRKIVIERGVGEIAYKTAYFNSKAQVAVNGEDIGNMVERAIGNILDGIGKWMGEGSGWRVDEIEGHYVNVLKYTPLRGTSYIELPKELRNARKGIINIRNDDKECFRWCHLARKFPVTKDLQRISKYKKHVNNYDGITFPVTTKQYKKVEKQNRISINVFSYEKRQAYLIYISKEGYEDMLDLLLITKGKKKHCLIKDFNRFMSTGADKT